MKTFNFRSFLTLTLTLTLLFGPLSPLWSTTTAEAQALDPEAQRIIRGLKNDNPTLPAAYGMINRDAAYTKDGLVNLEGFVQTAKDNAAITHVRFVMCGDAFGCKGAFYGSVWGDWQTLASLKPIDASNGKYFKTQLMLSNPIVSGVRGICVQTKDSADKISPYNSNSCDSIILDSLAPTGSVVINGGAEQTDSLRGKLDIYATDPVLPDGNKGSRGMQYTFSSDKVGWQTWEPIGDHVDITVTYPFDLKEPTHIPVYVKFKDAAGNESQIYSDTILYVPPTTAPTGANRFSINNDAAFTDNQKVQLRFFPSKAVSQIKVWNRGENSDQVAARAYSETMEWNLSNGHETKQVYVQFIYADGKKSEGMMDEIIFAPKFGIEYSPAVPFYSETTLGQLPTQVGAGIAFNFVLTVKNTGSTALLNNDAASKSNSNATHISYHWYKVNPDGSRSLYKYQGNRALLNNSLNYLEADNNVRFFITTPSELGKYVLQFDAVREDVSQSYIEGRGHLSESNVDNDWFSEFGVYGPEYNIEIIDGDGDNYVVSNSVPNPSSQTAARLGLDQSAHLAGSMSSIAASMRSNEGLGVLAASTSYTVQPPRPAPWHCNGYDCYTGIAEDFYQCSARGIANDVPNTTNEAAMVNKCWYPIYNANKHLYNGISIPPVYAGQPWQYLQVGWVLTIPADPFGGGGGGNPPVPGVPTLPPMPSTSNPLIPGQPDPYAGMNGALLSGGQITFDRFVAWDGSYKTDQIKWSETTRPTAPTITSIETSADGRTATVYGVAIPKNHPIRIGVWNEFRYCWGCGSGWEYFSQWGTAQHVKIALFKTDWTFLGYVWNDRADGRWSITLPLNGTLRDGDTIIAEAQIEADYWFSGLHWWSDTTETVNFNLRDRKYTGFPYFASYASNARSVPRAYLNNADWAIDYRAGRSSPPAGDLHQHCGAWIRDYHYVVEAGQSWQTYTNLIYNPQHNWAYRLRGDIRLAYWNAYNGTCGSLGLPTSDDQWAASSPWGTLGAYQNFEHGTIHSSNKGTFAIQGTIYNKFNSGGGTRTYGFPLGESSTISGQDCQEFELGNICSSTFSPRDVVRNLTPGEILSKIRAYAAQNSQYDIGSGFLWRYCDSYYVIFDYIGQPTSLFSTGGIMIYNPKLNTVFVVDGKDNSDMSILDKSRDLGWSWLGPNGPACSKLGYPVENTGTPIIAASDINTYLTPRYQNFEYGVIYSFTSKDCLLCTYDSHAFAILNGQIRQIYNDNWGTAGIYGMLKSDTQATDCYLWNDFANSSIIVSNLGCGQPPNIDASVYSIDWADRGLGIHLRLNYAAMQNIDFDEILIASLGLNVAFTLNNEELGNLATVVSETTVIDENAFMAVTSLLLTGHMTNKVKSEYQSKKNLDGSLDIWIPMFWEVGTESYMLGQGDVFFKVGNNPVPDGWHSIIF